MFFEIIFIVYYSQLFIIFNCQTVYSLLLFNNFDQHFNSGGSSGGRDQQSAQPPSPQSSPPQISVIESGGPNILLHNNNININNNDNDFNDNGSLQAIVQKIKTNHRSTIEYRSQPELPTKVIIGQHGNNNGGGGDHHNNQEFNHQQMTTMPNNLQQQDDDEQWNNHQRQRHYLFDTTTITKAATFNIKTTAATTTTGTNHYHYYFGPKPLLAVDNDWNNYFSSSSLNFNYDIPLDDIEDDADEDSWEWWNQNNNNHNVDTNSYQNNNDNIINNNNKDPINANYNLTKHQNSLTNIGIVQQWSSPSSASSSLSSRNNNNIITDSIDNNLSSAKIHFDEQESLSAPTSPTSTSDLWSLSKTEIAFRLIGAIICVAIILTTIVGNVLVIIVVARFHRMRTVTNILLASLAIADITVASLVMPFTVVYDLFRYWPWGPVLCHFWISCDVMCCTASILHLTCVAIDRFWAITRPLRYRSLISKRRLFCCIVIIWLCSVAISFIPIFSGWYHSQGPINIFTMEYVNNCGLDVNRVYATISSLTSFYLPLPIMFYVYFRILLVAERQSREIKQLEQSLRQNGFLSVNYCQPSSPTTIMMPTTTTSSVATATITTTTATITTTTTTSAHHLNINDSDNNNNEQQEQQQKPTPKSNGQNIKLHFSSLINVQTGDSGQFTVSNSMDHIGAIHAASNEAASLENKRHAERSLRRRARQLITDTKAIRTLGIVMGVFCLCWLPFFIMYVISAYCDQCNISYELRSSITWLGYVNSALNPAIYAYLNKEFKMAFKRVIFCLPPGQIENFERDAMLEEISGTTSRSYHHHHNQNNNNNDNINNRNNLTLGQRSMHGGACLDVPIPPTPGFVTRTPSTTVETPNWLLIQHAHS